jgi:methyl coenzyme M reductase subunit D
MMGPSLPTAHYGPKLGHPIGHGRPKLAQGQFWAQTWAPSWAMMGPSLPRAYYGPNLGPPVGHDGPKPHPVRLNF